MDVIEYYKLYTEKLFNTLQSINQKEIETLVKLVKSASKEKKHIFFIGNGGSASTASHWSNDFSKGLFHKKKLEYKAMSLTDNFSWISAIANDISYRHIFTDQIERFGNKGDLLISISASGNSENILDAIVCAKKKGITTISLVGFNGGEALKKSDYVVHIPTKIGEYGIVEDIQLILNHFICELLTQ